MRPLMIPATLALATLLSSALHASTVKNEIRCASWSRFDLGRSEGDTRLYDLALDLRLQPDGSGYLLLDGLVTSPAGAQAQLNRTLTLTRGKALDADTYRYTISGVKVSPADDAPGPTFTALLAELTGDPSMLQLDITEVAAGAYLIAGPVSDLFVCVRY